LWFLCEHEGFRHTQTYLSTTDVRTGVTTLSPVDELTFYVTEQAGQKYHLQQDLGLYLELVQTKLCLISELHRSMKAEQAHKNPTWNVEQRTERPALV
jgi:hypothetical protein